LVEIQGARARDSGAWDRPPVRFAGKALRTGPLGSLGDPAGYGRGGKRQHDQARDVRIEPPGLQRDFVQGALRGGSGPRFSVAGATRSLPARGKIGIFNRSYYEEVLVARVHPEICRGRNCRQIGFRKNMAVAF